MIPDGMTRVAVTLSDEILARLDEYRGVMGMTRSAAVASLVARQLVADRELIAAIRDGLVSADDVALAEQLESEHMERDGLLVNA